MRKPRQVKTAKVAKRVAMATLSLHRSKVGYSKKQIAEVLSNTNTKIEKLLEEKRECTDKAAKLTNEDIEAIIADKSVPMSQLSKLVSDGKHADEISELEKRAIDLNSEILKLNKETGRFMFDMDLKAVKLMSEKAKDSELIKNVMTEKLFSLMVLENKINLDDEHSLQIEMDRRMQAKSSEDNVHGIYKIIKHEVDIMTRDIKRQNMNTLYNSIKYIHECKDVEKIKRLGCNIYAGVNFTDGKYADFDCNDIDILINELCVACDTSLKDNEIVGEKYIQSILDWKYGFVSESMVYALDSGIADFENLQMTMQGCNKVLDKMYSTSILHTVESGRIQYAKFAEDLKLDTIEESYDKELIIITENGEKLDAHDYKYLKSLYFNVLLPRVKADSNSNAIMKMKFGVNSQLKPEAANAILYGINETNCRLIDEVSAEFGIINNKDTIMTDARALAIAYYCTYVSNELVHNHKLVNNAIVLTRGFYDEFEELNNIIKKKIIEKVKAFFADKESFEMVVDTAKEEEQPKDAIEE